MAIHLGKKIAEIASSRGVGATALGKLLNTTRENVYSIFDRELVDTPLLLKCSRVLDHDFVQYLYEDEALAKFKQAEVAEWEGKIATLEAEKAVLAEKVQLLESHLADKQKLVEALERNLEK